MVALAKRALVVHSGSSCTNPCSYFDLFTEVIHPFWSANPPERRLCNKPYKRIGHPTMFVPENSMLFKVRGCVALAPLTCACIILLPCLQAFSQAGFFSCMRDQAT